MQLIRDLAQRLLQMTIAFCCCCCSLIRCAPSVSGQCLKDEGARPNSVQSDSDQVAGAVADIVSQLDTLSDVAGEESGSDRTSTASSKKPRRFAILQTGEINAQLISKFGCTADMFLDWLQDEGSPETWDVFRCFHGEFPQEALTVYDGFVVTGSPSNAHDPEPWILHLQELIRSIYALRIRTIGVCFGHQIISRALGGDSGPAPSGWELGLREIVPTDVDAPVFTSSFWEMESHRDQVKVLPPHSLLLASSVNCPVEMYQAPSQNPIVMCTQFHPELKPEFVKESLAVRRQAGLIPDELAAAALGSLTTVPASIDNVVQPPSIRDLMKQFLKASN